MVLLKRNILLVFLGLVGIFVSTGVWGEDSSSANASAEREIRGLSSADFAEAYRLYTDEKYPESIRLFKAILHNPKEAPYHDLAQLYIIRANVMSGNHLLLEADCNRFLGRYPESAYTAEVVYVLGRYYFSVNVYDKTILEYSVFLNQHKDEDFEFKIPLNFWLGEAYLKLKKENEASTRYLYVIAEAPAEDPVGWRAASEMRMAELAKKHQREIPAEEVKTEPETPLKEEDLDLLREEVVGDQVGMVESPDLPEVEEATEVGVDPDMAEPEVDDGVDDTITALPEDLPVPEEKTPEISEVDGLKSELERIQKENKNIKEMVRMKERLMDLKLYYMEQRVTK